MGKDVICCRLAHNFEAGSPYNNVVFSPNKDGTVCLYNTGLDVSLQTINLIMPPPDIAYWLNQFLMSLTIYLILTSTVTFEATVALAIPVV